MNWIRTPDGSHTRAHKNHGEPYHNLGGALSESYHVYLKPIEENGYLESLDELKVLDIGFGLGLNWLTYVNYAHRHGKKLKIISLENDQTLLSLSYKGHAGTQEGEECIEEIKATKVFKSEFVDAQIILGNAQETIKKIDSLFNVFLHDPFSPTNNPEMWTTDFFKSVAIRAESNAHLLTFSVARAVRESLKEAQFETFKLKGFALKREQLLAKYISC